MSFASQIEDFLKSINDDFYLDLQKYTNWPDYEIHTSTESITQLLKIAEAAMIQEISSKSIHNTVDIKRLVQIALERIHLCEEDKDLASQALDIIRDMDCYAYVFTIDNEEEYVPDIKISNARKNFSNLKNEIDNFDDLVSSFDQDLDDMTKRRYSKFL